MMQRLPTVEIILNHQFAPICTRYVKGSSLSSLPAERLVFAAQSGVHYYMNNISRAVLLVRRT